MTEHLKKELIRQARAARAQAYAPYSRFRVGAALLARDGRIFTGCNIENASYSPSVCAERVAFAKAVSEGVRQFRGICIIGGPDSGVNDFCPPCGVCRQVMQEFCDPKTFEILLAKSEEETVSYTLSQLLPLGFDLSKSDSFHFEEN
ncbi:MAG: cytidine deaminase [Lachnospiraceae bacterium]|nr:cytidine deaminase [Lachnospiraceae bacterium]